MESPCSTRRMRGLPGVLCKPVARSKRMKRDDDRLDERAVSMLSGRMPRARPPHPIPYQGSKRLLAPRILAHVTAPVDTLIEPFAGSAAVSLAAALAGTARRFILGDSLDPLIGIWHLILTDPRRLADEYEALWRGQLPEPRGFYDCVRADFNSDRSPSKLLYLLARCVKNAVRFNPKGEFNQSPDNRRLGMRPERMQREILGASRLLSKRARAVADDYEVLLAAATPRDLVYMDPPYQGTSSGPDRRYAEQLDRERFIIALDRLNARSVPFIVSFDGRCGDKQYGPELPRSLGLYRIELEAGVSSQGTLAGRREITVESLYLSPSLRPDCIERKEQLTLRISEGLAAHA
ncbi:MAG: DNA adenine methylase [Polyangiaceae bacterium]